MYVCNLTETFQMCCDIFKLFQIIYPGKQKFSYLIISYEDALYAE